jgi:predicted acylesterase/phospholipase RssA
VSRGPHPGSEPPATPQTPRNSEASSPARVLPKIAVVLSPGGARTFAQVGVIKELLKARLPIEAVVGVEWGSLVAALYAQNGQIHEAEWKLYKLEAKEIISHSLFGGSRPQSVKSLDGFLTENLRGRGVNQAALRFACPSMSMLSGAFQWQERGEFQDVMRRCLPATPVLKPAGAWGAALISSRDATAWLRRQGYNVIILVDVLKSADYFEQERMLDDLTLASLYLETRRNWAMEHDGADDVIEVDTKGFKILDFDKRRELVSLGEHVGRPQAEALAKKYGF